MMVGRRSVSSGVGDLEQSLMSYRAAVVWFKKYSRIHSQQVGIHIATSMGS